MASYNMNVKLVLSEPLAVMLGHPQLVNKDILLTSAYTTLEGSKGVDEFGMLYLYCDMLEPSLDTIVGALPGHHHTRVG